MTIGKSARPGSRGDGIRNTGRPVPLDRGSASSSRGRFGDGLIIAGLSAVAYGNLALPADAQVVFDIDYLLLAVGVLAVMVILRLGVNLRRLRAWFIAIALVAAVVPGLLVAPLGGYGLQKAQAFAIMALCVVAAASLVDVQRGVAWILGIGVVVSMVVTLLVLGMGVASNVGRVTVFGLNPIALARLTGLAAIAAIVVLTYPELARRTVRFGVYGFAALGLVAVVLTGSRGPLAATALAGLLLLILLMSVGKVPLGWVLVAGVVIAVLLLSGQLNFDESVEWATGRGDSGRGGLYQYAIELARGNPAGIGWGNYGAATGLGDGAVYPHNMYLELTAEGGIVAVVVLGGVALLALLWGVIAFRRTRSGVVLLLLGMYTTAFVNAQFSSDIVGNRMLWVLCGLVVVCLISVKAGDTENPRNGGAASATSRVRR